MAKRFTRARRLLGAYHVYNQGFRLDGEHPRKLFVDREDRMIFLSLLARHLGRQQATDVRGRPYKHLRSWILVMAYCVMSTHFHLIVWQRDPRGIAELLNRVQASYTKHFNAKYANSRPLYAGPVCTKPIKSRGYFKWLVGYVHDNHPSGVEYEFSSHRAWVDQELRPGWLEVEPALKVFGGMGEYEGYLEKRARRKQLDRELF